MWESSLSRAVDTALDRSVALGYGKLGLALRRRLPTWPEDPPRMDGQVALITGAASGLGLAAGVGFAGLGAAVCVVARDQSRAQEAARQIVAQVPGAEVRPYACDVSRLAGVREFAASFTAAEARLDVLVNNAGVMPAQRTHTDEGHELMFATHVLGPFGLTAALLPLLKRSAPARVINISSGGMYGQAIPGDDLESEHTPYSAKKLYARSKREQVAMTQEWARRLAGTGVVVHAMHPGWADTKGVRDGLPIFRVVTGPIIRDSEQGADTIVWLAAAPGPGLTSGEFWHDRRTRPTSYRLGADDAPAEVRERLWQHCAAAATLAGIPVPGA